MGKWALVFHRKYPFEVRFRVWLSNWFSSCWTDTFNLHETMYFLRLAAWTLQVALFSDIGKNSLWFHILSMCNSVILYDIARLIQYRTRSVNYLSASCYMIYPITPHLLLDEAPSFNVEEGRKGVNHLKGNWRSIWRYLSKRSFALDHSDWFVETWHSFTL